MSTRVFNLTQNSAPIPGPNFFYARDKDGKSTGRHTFTVVRGALGLASNQARFKKGTPITALDTTLSAFFSHLLVVDHDSQDIPGGYSEVTVNCEGFTEDGEFETDREVSYSSQTQAVERSILLNPKYLAAVSDAGTRALFTKMFNGLFTGEVTSTGEGGAPTEVKVYDNRTDSEKGVLSDENHLKWYRIIFIEDRRTYEAPAYEWRRETTNAGGLSDSEINAVGRRDSNPAGNAPHPESPAGLTYTWLKTTAGDVRGENSATTEEVWQWGDWPADIYSDA